jgi:hypothetical protein
MGGPPVQSPRVVRAVERSLIAERVRAVNGETDKIASRLRSGEI